jgi:feruloyl-CoA synthase
MAIDPSTAPYRPVAFGPYEAAIERRPEGTVHLRARQPLAPYPERFTEHLLRWARDRPERSFLARRSDAPGRPWLRLSYADALHRVRALGQALLDLGSAPNGR